MKKLVLSLIALVLSLSVKAEVGDDFKNSFMVENYSSKGKSIGSAFAIEGYDNLLVTNRHVISNSEVLRVVDVNGKKYFTEIVYVSKNLDLALIKFIENKSNSGLRLCENSNVTIGYRVYNVGHPNGDPFVFNIGFVNSFNKNISAINNNKKMISVNLSTVFGGQSGSALSDVNNNCVLGVMVAKTPHTNTGFAIKVEDLKRFLMGYKSNLIAKNSLSNKS